MSETIIAIGGNLKLCRFNEDNVSERYISWLNDRQLMKYSRQSRIVHTKESCLEYLRSFAGSVNHFFCGC